MLLDEGLQQLPIIVVLVVPRLHVVLYDIKGSSQDPLRVLNPAHRVDVKVDNLEEVMQVISPKFFARYLRQWVVFDDEWFLLESLRVCKKSLSDMLVKVFAAFKNAEVSCHHENNWGLLDGPYTRKEVCELYTLLAFAP